MGEQSAEYFSRRERVERSAAASATTPVVRNIHLVMADRYAMEAVQCRLDARRYEGKPDQQFLLRLARSFEGLSVREAALEPSAMLSSEMKNVSAVSAVHPKRTQR